jgi:hypothetical protein
MNLGPLELLFLMVGAISLLGPVIAGVYLATRLNRPGRPNGPGLP